MMRIASFLLSIWITGNAVVLAQQSHQQQNLLEDALRAFGREEYIRAGRVLQKYAEARPKEAPQSCFYIGECYYKMNDLVNACKFFEQAFATPFNKDEAVNCLISIYHSCPNVT